ARRAKAEAIQSFPGCHSGMAKRRPGISRFRVRCFAPPRNDRDRFLIASPAMTETLTRDLFQLLQAAMPANLGRHLGIGKARVPIGDADLADIDVATRVQRDAVGGEEFAGLKSGAVLAA